MNQFINIIAEVVGTLFIFGLILTAFMEIFGRLQDWLDERREDRRDKRNCERLCEVRLSREAFEHQLAQSFARESAERRANYNMAWHAFITSDAVSPPDSNPDIGGTNFWSWGSNQLLTESKRSPHETFKSIADRIFCFPEQIRVNFIDTALHDLSATDRNRQRRFKMDASMNWSMFKSQNEQARVSV